MTAATYREIFMTNKNLYQYKLGIYIVNKAFLSTSKSRDIAEQFISISLIEKLVVICEKLSMFLSFHQYQNIRKKKKCLFYQMHVLKLKKLTEKSW
jgi:hypothetical protein